MTPEETQLLAEYEKAQQTLAAWKAYEQGLRKRVVATFGTAGKDEGRERRQLDDVFGTELIMTHRTNYKVHNDNGQVYWLRSIMPPEVFDDLFKESWDVSIKAYRALTPAQQLVVDYALEITPGLPALEIKQTNKVI